MNFTPDKSLVSEQSPTGRPADRSIRCHSTVVRSRRKRPLTRFFFLSFRDASSLARGRAINYQIQRARHTYLVNLVDGFTGGRWPRSRRPPMPVVNAGRRIPSGACVDSPLLVERPARSSRHHLCRRGRPCHDHRR